MSNHERKKITLTSEQITEMFTRSLEHSVRFLALANTGGVIATITVLSAVAKNGDSSNIFAWPLAMFSFGVVFSLLTSIGLFFLSGQFLLDVQSTDREGTEHQSTEMQEPWKTLWPWLMKLPDWASVSALACFIFGCIAGIFIVAFA